MLAASTQDNEREIQCPIAPSSSSTFRTSTGLPASSPCTGSPQPQPMRLESWPMGVREAAWWSTSATRCPTDRFSCPAAMVPGSTKLCSLTVMNRSRSEEHTSELQSLMRISYAVFCLKKKKKRKTNYEETKSQSRYHTTP